MSEEGYEPTPLPVGSDSTPALLASSNSAPEGDEPAADEARSPSERRRAAEAEEKLPFGELAVLEEMISREQLNQLLFQQANRRETEHKNVRIGTLLVREGVLSKKQAKRLLRIQREDGPIEGFQLLGHLGSGGMGSVFRAIEEETGRELALKILPPRASRDSRYRTRFLREATLLSKLDHPHLVRCYSHGECKGHLFFAMEYVAGCTGRALIKRDGAMSEKQLRKTFRQLLESMAHYWRELIVHRDIKPDNIIFTPELDAKLLDLGLSRQLDDDVHITTIGKTLGTPLYISPEMARGQQDIDIRADLYSLGATLYHLGTGVPPFVGSSQAELLKAHVEDEPLRPRLKNPRMSEGMEAILIRLLEKRPCDRFAGPSDVLTALDRLEAGEDPMPGRVKRRRTFSSGERALRRKAPERRTKGRLSSSGTRTGYRDRPARTTSAPTELPRYTPVLALVAFLALFGLGVLLGSNNKTEAEPVSQATAAAAEGADFLSQVNRDPEAAATVALQWCDTHPQELAEQVTRLELVDKVLAESSPQRHALRLRLLQARELLHDAAEAALDELRNRLITLVEAKRLDQARAALDAFPKSYLQGKAIQESYEELQRDLQAAIADRGV
jgi:serine/threonine protein kinase